MRISDWSSDVCSSDLVVRVAAVERLQRPHPLRRIPVAENAKRSLPVGHVVGLLELAEGERRRIVRAASGDIAERHGAQPPRALGGGRKLEPVGGVGGILPAPFVEKLLPKRLAQRLARLVDGFGQDRKSTRRTPVTNAHLVCRLL